MKNRRIVLMAFLLCACMIVGVGYAAFSDVMDITGTAQMQEDDTYDGNLYFSAAEALPRFEGDTILNTANVNPNNQDKAAFTVNDLVTAGDRAQFKFTITNTNLDSYNISVRGYTNNSDAEAYYSISSSLDDNATVIAGNGATLDVIVTVEMTETPESGDLVSASFLLELTVEQIVSGAAEEV